MFFKTWVKINEGYICSLTYDDSYIMMTLVVVLLCVLVVALAFNLVTAEIAFLSTLIVLIFLGLAEPGALLSGFSNPALYTIAALYVVVGGLKDAGATQFLRRIALGQQQKESGIYYRILPVTTVLSAVMNNTPVVAMFTGLLQSISKRFKLHLSSILLPLSYASILGGLCTLIGTSTNLVVDGQLRSLGLEGFNLLDMAYVGVPVALVGLIYLIFIAPRLLPVRQSSTEQFDNVREYLVEMVIEPGSELVRKSIQEVGLRNLPGLFLVEIEREGQILSAVRPRTVLEAGDRLVFAGSPDSVLELRNFQGLVLADDQRFKLEGNRSDRRLFEAVISPSNPMVGKTIKEARFRHRYSAVVLSVSRHGHRLKAKLGGVVIQAGDTLLVEAQKGFLMRFRNSKDFLLVSKLADSDKTDESKARLALAIFAGMIAMPISGLLPIFESSILAASAMVLTKCIGFEDASKAIDYSVLVIIACAFSIGVAVQEVGLAQLIAATVIEYSLTPLFALVAVYITCMVLTEVMTNNAAALVMLPIAISIAEGLQVNYEPFAIAIMIAASASFITPTGYQTNLMVMGPGGYHFSDYFKVGFPLSIIVAITALSLIPIVWGF